MTGRRNRAICATRTSLDSISAEPALEKVGSITRLLPRPILRADFDHRTGLSNVNFAMAIIRNAGFSHTTSSGFTKEQLYSTASYQSKGLGAIRLQSNDLSGWDLSGQFLRKADFNFANATTADFSQADLTGARLMDTTLLDADLSNAIIKDALLNGTTALGFTKEQLYSSQLSHEGPGATGLRRNDLSGWDFSGQNLTGASFWQSRVTATDLTNALVKGVTFEGTTELGFPQSNCIPLPATKPRIWRRLDFLTMISPAGTSQART